MALATCPSAEATRPQPGADGISPWKSLRVSSSSKGLVNFAPLFQPDETESMTPWPQ